MKLSYVFRILFLFFYCGIFAQSTASKQVTNFTINAPQLDTLKQIWVYLPKDYQNSNKRYPVMYMHDAQNLFDAKSSYVGEWQVDEYLDSLEGQQSIVIGIEHGNEKRIDELTPYSNPEYGGGQGDAYLDFIVKSLKPYVDATYRTKPESEHTTIFGSSLGGLISFYGLVKYPDVFGKAGVFSASFWFNERIYTFAKNADIPETSKFFFLIGEKEGGSMVEDQNRMISLLKSKGVLPKQIKSQIIKDGEHNEKLWSTYFGEAYQWLTNDE